jgi:Protein of unknown function (DUF1168)
MGRYSSVQAYADNHTGVRKVPYEQASGGGGGGEVKGGVKPEKVVNPYGSTAGAGSGDFHVYRHARNRELQRQQHMDLTAAEQEAEELFRRNQEENKEWEEERTAKRRKKRERQKNVKKRKQNLAKAGINVHASAFADEQGGNDNEDEFQYTPGEALAPVELVDEKRTNESKLPAADTEEITEIPNDGSFLEMMKQKLQQEQQQKQQPPTEEHKQKAADDDEEASE